jgi:hypothetical protein
MAVHEYAYIRRPNYEKYALLIWLAAGVGVYEFYRSLNLPILVFQPWVLFASAWRWAAVLRRCSEPGRSGK